MSGVVILHIMQGTNPEGCEEEIVNPPLPDGVQGDIYTTTDNFIHYESVLFGGELVVPPTQSKDALDNKIYLYVMQKEGDSNFPLERHTSYAFRNLTEISVTVKGVLNVTVWLFNTKAYRRWSRQTANVTDHGQKEKELTFT